MEIRKGMLLGRLSNGFQSDHGKLIHAVAELPAKRPPCPFNDFGRKVIPNDNFTMQKGLCGAKPARRSVGWTFHEITEEINCPKCLARMERMKKKGEL
jgi:hypothetical protein